MLSCLRRNGVARARDVTFTRDIAPIVFNACASCHRPGGPGPFSLTTYDEVRRRATQIAQVTKSRFMPPWKVEPAVGHFVGQRPLTDAEIASIERWASSGTPQGDPKHLPPLPKFADGWLLGQPDLIVKPEKPFTLPAQQTDAFRIFAIRVPVKKRTYVTGIEFHPGNARVVHHANIRIDRTDSTRRLDEADPLPGYDGLMPRSAEYPDGHFLGWTPGQVAPLVQPELAWTLEPGSDLVVQLHMQPSGAVEEVLPEIGFYFSDREPARTPTILRLGSQGIDIPPGESRYVIRDSYVLPVDVELLAVQPHAHYRAREIRGVATLPDGTSRMVMHIKDWDFRWQHVYRHESPIKLPKGTRLSMEYTYDNSAANARNPELPPARVFWGQRSRDEMGDLWFQLLAANDTDRRNLNAEITAKMTAEDIVGYETMLKVTPGRRRAARRCGVAVSGDGHGGQCGEAFRAFGRAQAGLGAGAVQSRHRARAGGPLRCIGGRIPGRAQAAPRLRARARQPRSRAAGAEQCGRGVEAPAGSGAARSRQSASLLGLAEALAARGAYDVAVEMLERAMKLALTEDLAKEIFAKRAEFLKLRKG